MDTSQGHFGEKILPLFGFSLGHDVEVFLKISNNDRVAISPVYSAKSAKSSSLESISFIKPL